MFLARVTRRITLYGHRSDGSNFEERAELGQLDMSAKLRPTRFDPPDRLAGATHFAESALVVLHQETI